MDDGGTLKSKAAAGLAWTALEKFGQQVVQFVIGVVVARILSPEDFGLVGMTAIFLAVANTVVDSGFGAALIQKRDKTESDYSTCLYFNVLVGLALYAVLWLAAPAVAAFYRAPLLADVLRVLGLSFVVNSLSISQTARMTAEMRFREMSVITVVGQLVTGGLGLALALAGWGVWALVAQQLAGGVARLVGMELCLRWVPRLEFSRASFRHLVGFGSKLLCSSLINTVYNNLYTLVIGRVFSAADVGHYNRANLFAALPAQTLLSVVMKVAYPLMAQVQDDTDKLRAAYSKFLQAPLFVLYPVLLFMAVLAEPLVLVLLGEKWMPAVPLLQALCLASLFDPLTHINLNILYVRGRTDLVLRLELLKKPIGFLILFASIPLGLWWLCMSRALYSLVAFAFNCHYTGRFIGVGFWRQMSFAAPVLLRSAAAAAVCLGVSMLFDASLARLVVGAVAGGVAYVGLAVLSRDAIFVEMVNIVKNRLMRRGGDGRQGG